MELMAGLLAMIAPSFFTRAPLDRAVNFCALRDRQPPIRLNDHERRLVHSEKFLKEIHAPSVPCFLYRAYPRHSGFPWWKARRRRGRKISASVEDTRFKRLMPQHESQRLPAQGTNDGAMVRDALQLSGAVRVVEQRPTGPSTSLEAPQSPKPPRCQRRTAPSKPPGTPQSIRQHHQPTIPHR